MAHEQRLQHIVVGFNTLDPSTWTHYHGQPLLEVLKENFGTSLPATTRLFHNVPNDERYEIRLETEEDCHRLLDLKGALYILVFPASPANLFLTSALLLTSVILQAIFPEDKKDPGRPPRTGSPSTALGNRSNRARLLARIPDYFGTNRVTPDLVAKPFIVYDESHRETEIAVMCLGRGQYSVAAAEVFEGDSLAQNTEGLSVEVYPPGVLPTFGSPDLQIGAPINEPVRNVYQLEAVNGLRLAPLNERTLHGTVFQHPYTKEFDEGLSGFEWAAMAFVYDGAGVGRILVPTTGGVNSAVEVTDKVSVGDFLECRYDPDGTTSQPKGSFNRGDRTNIMSKAFTLYPAAAPNLADNGLRYEVTAIFPTVIFSGGVGYVELTVNVPAAKQADWAALSTYMAPTGSAVAYNVSVLLTPILKANLNFVNEHGAFFIDDENMTSVVCNFVAERGLFTDDGKNAAAIDPKIAVFVAPANESGTATGAFQRFDFQIRGSATDTSTRALTAVIDAAAGLSFTGRALISVIREDFSMWRVEDPGQGKLSGFLFTRDPLIPIGGAYPPSFWNPPTTPTSGPYSAIYRARKGTVEDQVRWTHCYSLSEPQVSAFGDTTLVMTKTVASKAANVRKERRLNMLATRMLNNWNGTIFTGPLSATTLGVNAFFHILKDPSLGNVPNDQIDFTGIAAAFEAVGDYFADQEARSFSHCFDAESTTLEDMLDSVARRCFCIAYREGAVIKVKPDIATDSAVVLFNHRNILMDSQTNTVAFGPEADYNGARIDYQDDKSNTVESLTVPVQSVTKPREVSMAGLHSVKQAGWHAWRAYNRILYKNTDTEFQSTAEGFLAGPNDKVMVADQTLKNGPFAKTQDGELRGVSGLNIFTTQPVDISVGGPYNVFLQHTDGTVESIVVTASPNAQALTLASAPSAALVVDASVGVRTKYQLVAAATTRPQAFQIVEKSPGSKNGTWNIKASNYSHGYYFVDGLNLWIDPGAVQLKDLSPYKLTVASVSGATVTSDPDRGLVYSGSGASHLTAVTSAGVAPSYQSNSKSVWLNHAGGQNFDIFRMNSGPADEERWRVNSADNLVVNHKGNAVIVAPIPVGSWHMFTYTWNRDTGVINFYIDGEFVTQDLGHTGALAVRGDLRLFEGLTGLADDFRLYRRVLSSTEVRELYQKTWLP